MNFSSFKSSITKKMAMAITGLVLTAYVIAHMLGNLQIFLGQEQLNAYAEHLKNLPFFLWPAKMFLLLTLIIHLTTALQLGLQNKNARPILYCHEDTVRASIASRTMVLSGLVIFAFIIFHLLNFTFDKIHPEFTELRDAKGRDDVYSMVILNFRDPWVAGSYVFAMAVLYLHLSHGVSSMFQSLGLNNDRTKFKWRVIAYSTALLIFFGNCSIAFASFFGILKIPIGGG